MKYIHSLLAPAFLLLIATGCKKNPDTTVTPIDVVVKAAYADALGNYNFPKGNIAITLTNTVTGAKLTQLSDENGATTFVQISPGRYTAQANISFDQATYEQITGLAIDQEVVHMNSILPQRRLNAAENKPLEMKLAQGRLGEWIFKQIYYAGSHTTNGAVFRDQFIEICNNTDQVLYADSLYFGQVQGVGTAANSIDLSKGYFMDNPQDELYKQFNWGKSIGMIPASESATKDYVYMKSLYRIPGTGTQYPVAPGESIVIAATAQNHKAPFVGTDDKPISVKNPDLTIDLSQADFEVYLGNIISNAFASDVDNSSVPDCAVIEPGARDMVLDATARDAYALFKTERSLPEYRNNTAIKDFGYFPDPSVQTISASTSFYYQIPTEIILDAVQIQHPSANSRVPRRVHNALDAGAYNVPAGQYSSQSMIRKTAKIVNGRRVLMDTNNSSNDFDFFPLANPKGFKD